ncbi:DUF3995 domain-containing protein [Leptospira sp. WS39.C2]
MIFYTILLIFTSLLLFILSLIHIYWAFGGLWPGDSKQDLIDKVFGKGNQFPSPISCIFVASSLLIFSLLPILWMNQKSEWINPQILIWVRICMAFVSFIFFIRGVLGYLPFLTKHWKPIFVHYTKRIYNPLCLFLGFAFLMMIILG